MPCGLTGLRRLALASLTWGCGPTSQSRHGVERPGGTRRLLLGS